MVSSIDLQGLSMEAVSEMLGAGYSDQIRLFCEDMSSVDELVRWVKFVEAEHGTFIDGLKVLAEAQPMTLDVSYLETSKRVTWDLYNGVEVSYQPIIVTQTHRRPSLWVEWVTVLGYLMQR